MKTTVILSFDPIRNHLDIQADGLPEGQEGLHAILRILLRGASSVSDNLQSKSLVVANGVLPTVGLRN